MQFIFKAALVLCSSLAMAQGQKWEIDSGHASVVFKINHLGFSNVYGTVGGVEGKLVLDEAKPEASSFDIKAPVAKISTGNQKRDDHLRSPDFFNAKQFPYITLKSKSVKKNGEKYDVQADLTLHGVTKPVAFTFTRSKTAKDPWGNMRTGGDTTLKIKRTDYGMNFMSKPGEVGSDVELLISLEAVQK